MKKISTLLFTSLFSALLLSTIPIHSQANNYDKAHAIKALTVRADAGTSYKALGKIKKKSVVKVYGAVAVGKDQMKWSGASQYGWSRIKYKGHVAYVKTHELTFVNPYKWTPGVKQKVVKSLKKNYGIKEYKFVKLSPQYYTCKTKINGKWTDFVTVNCKTGWYHG
ncbi:SH3 domain-containing protein [uncultured Rummeliibacillus sp.]|uniref:SH3 domain-containing protein n=1 Tax=uncultured Rummeliibacillus sp. TaxID=762292 RepID=UPI00262F1C52|nr:SH3 domain-containing protein [uncultured Rummeliibacillus sp.]